MPSDEHLYKHYYICIVIVNSIFIDRVYADWKVKENHIKITKSLESWGKSGKVREFEKNVVPGQGKSGKMFLSKYLIRV